MLATAEGRLIRATADPNIFRNDRVLRALIKREMKPLPAGKNYFG
jgi:hypothetical protein